MEDRMMNRTVIAVVVSSALSSALTAVLLSDVDVHRHDDAVLDIARLSDIVAEPGGLGAHLPKTQRSLLDVTVKPAIESSNIGSAYDGFQIAR
jgi:hypothetical protein